MKVIFTEKGFYIENEADSLTAQKNGFNNGQNELAREFQSDKYRALYMTGFKGIPRDADASLRFLVRVSEEYFRKLTSLPELELARENAAALPDEEICEKLLTEVPFAIGSEFITKSWIKAVFEKLHEVFAGEITAYEGTVAMYLAEQSQQLHVPERIFFHLVENKEDGDFPFAFLATYATKGEKGRITHMPLQYALTEYSGRREKLLALLACLNEASEHSEFVRTAVESGEMFHPLRLTAQEAYQFLKEIPQIEASGILCRIPDWWRKKQSSVSMKISIGDNAPSLLGFDSILSATPRLEADGMPLTREDVEQLLCQTEGLAYIKGKWVEVNHDRLKRLLEELDGKNVEITLLQALRGHADNALPEDEGVPMSNGKWLSELLLKLRQPENIRKSRIPGTVNAQLRPYQRNGYTWLHYMWKLGFGACLADDMGLGKTLQALTFMEKLRRDKEAKRILLIVPASLLGNWQKEALKFVPDMPVQLIHGSGSAENLKANIDSDNSFLFITTYGMTVRVKEFADYEWDCVVLDEAQAIKNPATKQTHAVKKIPARMRIAMTGTPVENDLTNLWSIFDFIDKGLLGSFNDFRGFSKQTSREPERYAQLRSMISPFMLRRLKTDKRIISDLPEKVETLEYVSLSKKQVVLYRKTVNELAKKLDTLDGIERCGLILAALTNLKQICNHPSQYLGQEAFPPEESGKWAMLETICSTIYEKRERVLVFTQFKEMTEPISAYLETIFHKKGFVLHGGTSVSNRTKMVEAFNGEEYIPYMVLSVKAGGTGLNLTAANHVIHFDRWWNPAVENQATDRAFRIGQRKNVFVHKLVCEKTIEEKIDQMLHSKKELAENVVGSGENWITDMSNEQLLTMLKLEI